ncbi:MAG TPA: DUF2911 domain-containing protein [Longimicrobiales bacterium]|nr:DUF2911 domain-containing protein [Longimicrobiales bacterium]
MLLRWLYLLLFLHPHLLFGQIKLSEKATVAQTINGTTVSLEYYRPVARGRDTLFGKVVRWNEVWTPGANWATTFEVDRDIRLNGHRIEKGKYSVWLIPAPDSAWTFFLNKNPRLFHTRRPRGTDDDIVRFRLSPKSLPHMEALMWYFPTIERDSAVLRMHWGTTAIDLRINTDEMERGALTAEQRANYLGTYVVRYEGDKDSTIVQLIEEGKKLVFSYTAQKPENSYTAELIPRGESEFAFGYREKGQVVDVSENPWRFQRTDQGVVSFEIINGETGKVMARARKSR